MANLEHVLIARKGMEAIAQWRKANPGQHMDFTNGSLSYQNFIRADLKEADFRTADLVGVYMNGANLEKANLSESVPHLGRLAGANLREADLSKSTLSSADLTGTDLTGANLSGADLHGANLGQAILRDADLTGAKVSEASLTGADLSGANLKRADFGNADLSQANLTGANLVRTLFYRTSLRRANLRGAVLYHTVFGDCDLSRCVGLQELKHDGPSVVGVDTLVRSGRRIPEVFLRGAGVPEDSIQYQRKIAASSSKHFSCFISSCTSDQPFTQRLRADLEAKGVRCWYFAADARAGPWLMDDVDRGIHYYDKQVVVCSTDSLMTEYNRDEVVHAIRKQEETGRRVFFPVGISDTVFDRRNRYVRSLGLWSHHIFDFRRWEDPKVYSAALGSLVQALKKDQRASAGMVRLEAEEA